MLLNEFLKNSAKLHPDKTAVVYQKECTTYSQLDILSDSLADYLIENGLTRGDRVAIFLDNSIEYIASFFGVLKAGGVAVPLNTQMVSREISFLISDCAPKFVIAGSKHKNILQDLVDDKALMIVDNLALLDSKRGQTPKGPVPVDSNSLAMIIYTSGTTGRPKGVMLSHKNLNANADSIVEYLKISSADKMMVVLPFYYSYGTSILTTHIKVGATLVIDNRFIYPNVILDTMEKEGVTGFAGVPSHYAILLRKSAIRKFSLSKLRYVTQAGGAMPECMIEEFINIFPNVKFYVMYGQTEACARLTYLEPELFKQKKGSIGKAIPGVEIDVLNEQGKKVLPGKTGEIVARGLNIMLGYWDAPQETAQVLKKEGLFTGDLATVDAEGFIYLVSRKKEMIKSGANRISPFEIEEVVCRMPGVLECAAVGIKDEILGEVIKLFVVKNGINLTKNDLLLFCKQNLAVFKMPKVVEFVKSLPKTSTGKIKRQDLMKGLSPRSVKRGQTPKGPVPKILNKNLL